MKYLRKYNEEFEKTIEDWCLIFRLKNYTINDSDNSVDVVGDVKLFLEYPKAYKHSAKQYHKIPIRFNWVSGKFDCSGNSLLSLINSPHNVGFDYDCSENKIESLRYCMIERCNGTFRCSKNKLTTLKYGPKEVKGTYGCIYNNLITLEGCPIKANPYIICDGNPIYEVYRVFKSHQKYIASLDYKYLRGTNIIKRRFDKACEDGEIDVPDSIKGYEYI
jgi:hypothetical protein